MNSRLRASVIPADSRGLCLACGNHKTRCICAPIPRELDPPRDKKFMLLEFGGQVVKWLVCNECRILIALTEDRPAVRCPHCLTVN